MSFPLSQAISDNCDTCAVSPWKIVVATIRVYIILCIRCYILDIKAELGSRNVIVFYTVSRKE